MVDKTPEDKTPEDKIPELYSYWEKKPGVNFKRWWTKPQALLNCCVILN